MQSFTYIRQAQTNSPGTAADVQQDGAVQWLALLL